MPVIQCPHCRKAITVQALAAGRRTACAHCRQWFAISEPPAPAPRAKSKVTQTAFDSAQTELMEPEHVAALIQSTQPEPDETRHDSRRLIWILSGVAGALSLLLVILIAVWLRGSPPNVLEPGPNDVAVLEPKISPPNENVVPPLPKPTPTAEPPKIEPPKIEPKAEPPKIEPKVERPKAEPKVEPRVELVADVLPPDELEKQIANFIDKLNDMRKAARLGPVSLDADLSRGCLAHAKYVNTNRNHPKLAAVAGLQDEDPSFPGFDEAGQTAARSSMLAFADPVKAVDLWFGRMSSRSPLLHPDLRNVGVGAARSPRGEWVCVVDPLRGQNAASSVAYPAPNQKGVPLSFSGGPEVADAAAGFPVSLQFPVTAAPTAVNALLTDERGNRVPVSLSTPEQPLPGVRRPGLIGMIPKQPLHAKTTYRARVSGQLDDKPFTKEWTFVTEDDGDEDGAQATKMLERINRLRRQADLKPVTLDTDLSRACRMHARYLVVNAQRPETQGMGAHREEKTLPGYTQEGEKAAKASDIALGDYEPSDALDGWMSTLYHRVPILEPELRAIGFGCARGRRLGWVTVLDVATRREPGARSRPVFWPVENQTDVPLNFPPGGETPNPIPDDTTGRAGYPITAFFPYQSAVSNAKASLEDAKGQTVPCWFSSKESPANSKFVPHQGNTICLIPKEPLQPEQTYRVVMSGDNAFKKSWTFTTAKSGPATSEAVRAAVDRFNKARLEGGLPPVALEARLSAGCQAHANYLVRNAAMREAKGFSLVNEDPKLPGYSIAGQTSAKRSDVFWLAPSSTTQIDDLLGTLYRRSFALDPRLRRIGLGCAYEVGQGWINVLDLNSGRDDGDPVVFPSFGFENVPIQGRDRVPGEPTSGFPVTIWFPGQPTIRDVRATLAEPSGATIDIWLSTPAAPLDRNSAQPNVIAIHPLRPLRPGRVYSVNVNAEVNGAPWRHTGRFSTAGD